MANREFMGHLLLLSACRVLNYDCNEFVSERHLAERLWITLLLTSWDLTSFCIRQTACTCTCLYNTDGTEYRSIAKDSTWRQWLHIEIKIAGYNEELK